MAERRFVGTQILHARVVLVAVEVACVAVGGEHQPAVDKRKAVYREVDARGERLLAREQGGVVAVGRERAFRLLRRTVGVGEQHVRNHNLCPRFLGARHGILQQIGRQIVVLRHIEYVVALSLLAHYAYVARRVALAVVLLAHYLYALVGSSQLLQYAQAVVGRLVVERYKLPICVCLRRQRPYGALQVSAAVVNGHEYRDFYHSS